MVNSVLGVGSTGWSRKFAYSHRNPVQLRYCMANPSATRPLDTLSTFATSTSSTANTTTRYAVRQVLDQEYTKHVLRQRADARQARYNIANPVPSTNDDEAKENAPAARENLLKKKIGHASGVKRDFFGRVLVNEAKPKSKSKDGSKEGKKGQEEGEGKEERKVWVSYHEGFSNAVRKPISLAELMGSL